MEEVKILKLNIEQIKQILFSYYNIDISAKFDVVTKQLEDADLVFHIKEKKIISSLEIENTHIITQTDLNNIIDEKLNSEGLMISNYYYNNGGNREFKLITYNLKKKEKVKTKSIGGKNNV